MGDYSKVLELPKIVMNDRDYATSLIDDLQNYIEYLKQNLHLKESVISKTEENVKLITACINNYYSGQVSKAKKNISSIIEKYINNKFIVSEIDKSYSFRGLTAFDDVTRTGRPELYEECMAYDLCFFKARIGENSFCNFDEKEMLHIPFSKREIISTQRFSIPGVPCLYFGTSSYVCWEELNRPSIERFNVSSYCLPKDLTILNLTIDMSVVDGLLSLKPAESNQKLATALIEIWPLVCATSYKVKDEKRVFKSEYIISQIIMECIKEHKIDGVAYYTKMIPLDKMYPWRNVNLAILACEDSQQSLQHNNSSDYAIICRDIKLTKPVNAKEYEFLTHPHTKADRRNNAVPFKMGAGQRIKFANSKMYYEQTLFGRLDNYLILSDHEKVQW